MLNYSQSPAIHHIEEIYYNKGKKLIRETEVFFKEGTTVEEVLGYDNKNNSFLCIMKPHQPDPESDFVSWSTYYKYVVEGVSEVVYESDTVLPEIYIFNSSESNINKVHIDSSAWKDLDLLVYVQSVAELM